MSIRSLIAVVLGGVIAFVWSSISWMAIPWHQPTMQVFENEIAVGQLIRESAPEPGIYTYPGWTDDDADMQSKHNEGPYVFASVVPAGVGSEMMTMMLGGLLIYIVGAALLAVLLSLCVKTAQLRAAIVAALFISLIPALMSWNWWHYPLEFTLVSFADSLIAWMLSAVVMIKIGVGGNSGEPSST